MLLAYKRMRAQGKCPREVELQWRGEAGGSKGRCGRDVTEKDAQEGAVVMQWVNKRASSHGAKRIISWPL